jgi:hypothetical protein
MIKIINISGSMHEKQTISSKFCMASKGKHWVFLKDRFGRPERGSEWEPIKILPFG